MKRSALLPAAALVASAALLLTSCTTGGGSAADGPAPAGSGTGGATAADGPSTDTIRTTIDQPATFDPTQSLSLPDFLLARASFDTLVRKDEDNQLAPGLASAWESEGNTSTFTLREGATCSDGTPITADIVKASLEYLTAPETAAAATPQIFGPLGEPTFTAVDAQTLTIELAQPWPDMLVGLTMSASGVICPAGLEDPEALGAGPVEGAESGAYTLTSSDHGVRYTYTLRDDYDAWPEYADQVPGTPATTVEYNVITDKNATANQLIAEQLDIGFINAQSVPRVEGTESITVDNQPLSDFYVLFNEREGSPFTDPAKRQAVAQTLDRAAFENVTSSGQGQVSTVLVPEGTACADPEASPVIGLDPAAAGSALEGVRIRMVGPQIAGPQGSGNTYIQEQLRAAGATVELSNLDVGGWVSTVFGKPGDWDMTLYADLNFIGTMSNPIHSMIGPSVQEGGGNIGATDAPEAAAAMERYWAATDEHEACAAVTEASDAILRQAHAIPLSVDPRLMASREGFTVVSKGGALDDQHLRITD
ncbi:ABC transporter substrate-binding protein [Citricoccus alkalitolerans]|uniref:ABC transporter substrate-binding protein n=1 Tax=Citricoccus alkalitolerans TaxID=246603 RepID=A0ABV8XWZ4_9MICC